MKEAKKEVLEARAEKDKNEAKVFLTSIYEKKDKAEAAVEEADKELAEVSKDLKVFEKK